MRGVAAAYPDVAFVVPTRTRRRRHCTTRLPTSSASRPTATSVAGLARTPTTTSAGAGPRSSPRGTRCLGGHGRLRRRVLLSGRARSSSAAAGLCSARRTLPRPRAPPGRRRRRPVLDGRDGPSATSRARPRPSARPRLEARRPRPAVLDPVGPRPGERRHGPGSSSAATSRPSPTTQRCGLRRALRRAPIRRGIPARATTTRRTVVRRDRGPPASALEATGGEIGEGQAELRSALARWSGPPPGPVRLDGNRQASGHHAGAHRRARRPAGRARGLCTVEEAEQTYGGHSRGDARRRLRRPPCRKGSPPGRAP